MKRNIISQNLINEWNNTTIKENDNVQFPFIVHNDKMKREKIQIEFEIESAIYYAWL